MDEPYNELSLTHSDGRQVPPTRFRTLQEAMTAAEDYRGASGAIMYHPAPSTPVLEVVRYSADGTIEVGADVPDDDEDEPWTEEEIAANLAAGREPTAAERAQYGIAECRSADARTAL